MENYKYTEPVELFNPLRIFSIVFSLLSLVFVHTTFGLIILFATLISYFILTGFEINKPSNKYRIVISVFGIFIGNWKKLPAVEYVTVVGIIVTRKSSPKTAFVDKNMGDKEFVINLIVDDRLRYITLVRLEKKNAIKVAMEIGEKLDFRVLDYTSPKEKWIR